MNALIRSAVCGVLLLMALDGWAEEPLTPIGYLLINPTALHRKALKLAGVTHHVAAYSEEGTVTKQLYCGADFELEDETGKIEVIYRVRCQAGEHRAVVIGEKMHVVVEGNMEAPPTIMRGADGNAYGVKIVARTVTPVRP